MNASIASLIIDVSFLSAAFLFIYGLKRMSSPVTAASGIRVAGLGMLVAVIASFLYVFSVSDAALPFRTTNVVLAAIALVLGLGWAWVSGKRVEMTAMPQMVALYNGMGGGAAATIGAIELFRTGEDHALIPLIVTVIGSLIGAISLSGSLIAWAKLDGRINGVWRVTGLQLINGTFFFATLGFGLYIALVAHGHAPVWMTAAFFIMALIFGVLMTMPIGGADMPVVISLYNAFTGLAVGFEGFVLQNPALMIAGMVVGSAGTLLTLLMAKAMNRSVSNVIFSNFGAAGDEQQGEIKGSQKPAEAGDAAVQPGQGAQQGALAAAGAADQGHELSRGDVQVQAVEHAAGAVEAAVQVAHPDGRGGGVRTRGRVRAQFSSVRRHVSTYLSRRRTAESRMNPKTP